MSIPQILSKVFAQIKIFQNDRFDVEEQFQIPNYGSWNDVARAVRWCHPARVLEDHFRPRDQSNWITMPYTEKGFGSNTTTRVASLSLFEKSGSEIAERHASFLLSQWNGPHFMGHDLILAGECTREQISFALGYGGDVDGATTMTRIHQPRVFLVQKNICPGMEGGIVRNFERTLFVEGHEPHTSSMEILRFGHPVREIINQFLPVDPQFPMNTTVIPMYVGPDPRLGVALIHVYTKQGKFVTQTLVQFDIPSGTPTELQRMVRNFGQGIQQPRIPVPKVVGEVWYKQYSPDPPVFILQDIIS